MKHKTLVSDDLWEAVEPFLPKEPPKPQGGRPGVPDRAVGLGGPGGRFACPGVALLLPSYGMSSPNSTEYSMR